MQAHSDPALIRRIAPAFVAGVLPESGCYLAVCRIGRQPALARMKLTASAR
jgi:hypothetical protein